MKSTPLFGLVLLCLVLLCACSKETETFSEFTGEAQKLSFSQAVDLAHAIHAHLDFANIIEEEVVDIMMGNIDFPRNYIKDLPLIEGFALRQSINFPRNYTDRYGNSISGNLDVLMDNTGNKLLIFTNLNYAGLSISYNGKGAGFQSSIGGSPNGGWVIGDLEAHIPDIYGNLLQYYPDLQNSEKLEIGNNSRSGTSVEGFFARAQTEGENTIRVDDNVYDMGGVGYVAASGIFPIAFRVHDPIVHASNCRWYRSGAYTIETDEPITVTFQSNECSAAFSVTYKGRTRTFSGTNYHPFWD